VCPSSYDVGEDLRVVLLSVTEGEDKPLKYPTIFNTADLAVLTKMVKIYLTNQRVSGILEAWKRQRLSRKPSNSIAIMRIAKPTWWRSDGRKALPVPLVVPLMLST
jgi:Ni2+-binding GTPase involved in maturation of urease and hydrogenase